MNFPYPAQNQFSPIHPCDRAYTDLQEASSDDYESELLEFDRTTVNVVERYQARLEVEALGVDDLVDLLNRKSTKLALVEVVNCPLDGELPDSCVSVQMGEEQFSSNDSPAVACRDVLASDLKSLTDSLREVQSVRRKLGARGAAIENVQSELYAKKAALEESLRALHEDSVSLRQDRLDGALAVIDVARGETESLLMTVERAIEYSLSVQLRCQAALAEIKAKEQAYLDVLW